jgi:uncharacterized protein (TIGR02569 family)
MAWGRESNYEGERTELPPVAAFGLSGSSGALPGGEGRTYRIGGAVLRREHERDRIEAAWLGELFAGITPRGFRLPRPLPTVDGGWVSRDGWTAWTFLEGRPATRDDVPDLVDAINSFHVALASVPYPAHLAQRDSFYDRADRWACGTLPTRIDPPFAGLVHRLAAVRRPVRGLTDQLIHGDLNPENILIAPGQPPAILDMAPYWRPAPFATAIAAYWLGPFRGDASVLDGFRHLPQFGQLLVRAGLRMLLSAWQFGHTQDFERYRTATDMIYRRASPDPV